MPPQLPPSAEHLESVQLQLVFDASLTMSVLLSTTILSVYKPGDSRAMNDVRTAVALLRLDHAAARTELCAMPGYPPAYTLARRRSALLMTDTEERLIASAAIMGDNNHPVSG